MGKKSTGFSLETCGFRHLLLVFVVSLVLIHIPLLLKLRQLKATSVEWIEVCHLIVNELQQQSEAATYPQKCLDVQNEKYVGMKQPYTRYTPSIRFQPERCLLYIPPSRYISVLRHILTGDPRSGRCHGAHCPFPYGPYDKTIRDYGIDYPPTGYTLVGGHRLDQMRAAVLEVEREQVPGAIMELGVWRGGVMLFSAAVLRERREAILEQNMLLPPKRDLYLFDAFPAVGKYNTPRHYLSASQEEVEDAFDWFDLRDNPLQNVTHPANSNIHFVNGNFDTTLTQWAASNVNESIAILRIDFDSWRIRAETYWTLFCRIPMGGFIIFDDYGTHGSGAGYETEPLTYPDIYSAWFRKTKTHPSCAKLI
jgi:hypothetical protein